MSLVMDFIQGIENTARVPLQFAEDFSNTAANIGTRLGGGQDETIQQNMGGGPVSDKILQLSQATGKNRQLAGDTAQIALAAAAPAVVGPIGETADAATQGASKFVAGVTKGAAEGAAIGGPQGIAQGAASDQKLNGKNLTMDFLQGAGTGAAFGGVIGGAMNRTSLNQAGAVGNNVLDDDTASQAASEDDPNKVEKILTPTTGPVVAKDVAPEVAQTNDPNIVKNEVQNDVNNKVAPAVPNPSPAPTPLPPVTSVSDINTPEQVAGQGSAAEANYSPDQQPVSQLTGQRPDNDLQTQIEQAHNAGDTATEARLTAQLSDQGMNPNAALSSEAKAQLIAKAQQNPEEQSLLQSGGQLSPKDTNAQPFLNAPGETPTGVPSHVSHAAGLSGMEDILNSGGSTDEALTHYMDTTGATENEAKGWLDHLMLNSGSLDRSKINASLNPQYNNATFPEATSKDAAVLNGQYANNKVIQAGRPAVEAMQRLDEHDLSLVRSLKGRTAAEVINQAHDPEQFAKVANALKDYNDYTQAAGAQLRQDIPYRQNYGLRTPYLTPQERDGLADEGQKLQGNPQTSAYRKQRQYQTHEEAIANGEVPRYDSALEDLQNDIGQRAHDQSQLALQQGLEKIYPGQVARINDGQLPTGYRQLLIPNSEKLAMPSGLADEINSRQMAQQATGVLGKYDELNAAGKNLELGGGLFHGANTGGIFVGQQIASGKLFTNPVAAGDVVKNLFSENSTKNYLNQLGKEGTFDDNHSVINAADAAGLNYKNVASDIGSPEDKGLTGKISSIPVLKQIHQAIFERQIPTMMMETFRQKTQNLDIFGNADDRESAIKIAKEINQNYGHLNRAIQGLTPKQFKLASRALLATDYQEGQLRTLADAFSKGGADGRLAREAVFGKALVFGGLATLGAAAGGDFKDQTPEQVALAIMNKAINPSFDISGYKVGLPATQISNVAKPIEESIAGAKKGTGIAAGPEDFLSSHAAFLPSKAEEFGTNKNFEGNAVYGKDYFGRPIGAGTVAANAISGVLPIPLAQTASTATGGESAGAAIANTAGLNVSPQYNLNYAPVAGQTYVQELEKTPGIPRAKIAATTEFFDLLGQGSKGKTNTINQAEKAIIAKNPTKANQIIEKYNQQLLKTLTPWAQGGGSQYLDSTMLSLLKTAEITYKKANQNVRYDVKTNPTAYGASIQSLNNQGASNANLQTSGV